MLLYNTVISVVILDDCICFYKLVKDTMNSYQGCGTTGLLQHLLMGV